MVDRSSKSATTGSGLLAPDVPRDVSAPADGGEGPPNGAVLKHSQPFRDAIAARAPYEERRRWVHDVEQRVENGEISSETLIRCVASDWGLDRIAGYVGQQLRHLEASLPARFEQVRREWNLLNAPPVRENTRMMLYEAMKSYYALLTGEPETGSVARAAKHSTRFAEIGAGLVKNGWDEGRHIRGLTNDILAIIGDKRGSPRDERTEPDGHNERPKRSIKERLENSIVMVSLGCIVAGFTAGFGAHTAFLTATNQEAVVRGSFVQKAELAKYILRPEFGGPASAAGTGLKVPPSRELTDFANEAAAHGNAYVILSVLEHVSLVDAPATRPTRRTASVRITYSLYCLRDIDKTEEVFQEQITGRSAKSLGWRGTNRETGLVNTAAYSVSIECRAGDVVTLQTGNDLLYELPRPESVSALGITVDKTDVSTDFWSYPAETDYIWTLTIVVDSNVVLEPIADGLRRLGPKGGEPIKATQTSSDSDRSASQSAIVGHWMQLRPAEQVTLAWKFDHTRVVR